MKYYENTIHTSNAGVVVIYDGVQKTVNSHKKLHLFMCNHEALNCIEIFANNPVPGEEDQRVYINAELVMSKLENGVLLDEFDRRMKELLSLNQIHDRSALLKDVTSRLVVNFLLDRIKIQDESDPSSSAHPARKRYSIFIEPKANDARSPKGTVDFQYESKPAKVTPAKIVAPDGTVLAPDADDDADNPERDLQGEQLEAVQEELEDGDDELCEIKNMNQFIRRSISRSRSSDSHDLLAAGGVLLPPSDDWVVGEDHPVDSYDVPGEHTNPEEGRRFSYTDILIENSTHSGIDRVVYDSGSDDEKEGADKGELPLHHTEHPPSSPGRKMLIRKRSMSESDLCVKAAGLVTLHVGIAGTAEGASTGVAGAHDDIGLLRRTSTSKSGKKQLLPLGLPSDFKYASDVPVDVKVPSYLAHTSSNYAKKLPPILRGASPATIGSGTVGGGVLSRPHTADGNSSRSSSGTRIRPSSSHGGAIGRLHDLKNSHEVSSGSNSNINNGISHSDKNALKKSPNSVSGVVDVDKNSCRIGK